MPIRLVHVRGYRSLRDVLLRPERVNVITGQNGSGKSNLYRSLFLLAQSSAGNLAASLAAEGGVASALWAGPRKKGAVRVRIEIDTDDFAYEIDFGLRPSTSRASLFQLDPDVKSETLRLPSTDGKPVVLLERQGSAVHVRDGDGRRVLYAMPLDESESALAQIRDPHRYPELTIVRDWLSRWRFYHHFRTDAASHLRNPQIGVTSPILTHDGSNLVGALQTIREYGDRRMLDSLIGKAFQGRELVIRLDDQQRMFFELHDGSLNRRLHAQEFSDGTLKFLCLLAALMSTRPAGVLILNEPEASLHPDLFDPLAEVIALAGTKSQVFVVSHSSELAQKIAARCSVRVLDLAMHHGETQVYESSSQHKPCRSTSARRDG
jgi:predicted ATPase